MNIKPLIKLIEVEIKLFLREPIALFFSLVFPIMLLLIFGAAFGKYDAFCGFRVIDLYVPALIAMIIGMFGLMNMPIVIAESRQAGIFKRFKATPLSPGLLLTVETAVVFIICLVSIFLLVVVSKLIWGVRFGGDILTVFVVISLSCASFLSLGFALSALASTARSAQAIGSFFFFPMLFLSGCAIPKEMFPEFLLKIANIIPLTYVVDMITNLWTGNSLVNQMKSIGVLLAMLIVCIFISVKTFRWE